jgi:hypothetical protein
VAAPASTLSAVRYRLVDTSATNPNLVTGTTLQAAVDMAVSKFSLDRPRVVVEDETTLTSPYVPIVGTGAVLASWVDGFSTIRRLEFPAGVVGPNHTPTYLEEGDDFEVGYRDATKTYLRLKTVVPTASEVLRVTYTAPHTHTDASNTISSMDLEALYDLAAHFGCVQLATRAAASSDPLIQADSVNHRDSQLRFKQQADVWMDSYKDRMGIEADGEGKRGVAGASVVADWDERGQHGYPFLTHWHRRR